MRRRSSLRCVYTYPLNAHFYYIAILVTKHWKANLCYFVFDRLMNKPPPTQHPHTGKPPSLLLALEDSTRSTSTACPLAPSSVSSGTQ